MEFPRPELLLHQLIPPPLHGLAPRVIKGQVWWDKQRKAAAAKNNDKCWACNVHKTKAKRFKRLEGHEAYKIDSISGRCELDEIVSLCHYCHNYIHHGRLRVLIQNGTLPRYLYEEIIAHGDKIIAGLHKPEQIIIGDWAKWYLVIDGVIYHGRFRSEQDWIDHYRSEK